VRLGPFVIAASLLCTIAGAARANGRFPQAQAMVSAPGSEGKTLWLRATFGLLVSHDAGATWQWVCEQALGYTGQWDPPIAVTRDGKLWVGRDDGIVSTPDGCSVEVHPELAGETVRDLTTDPKGEVLWVATSAPGKKAHVWRKVGQKPFERLGDALGEMDVRTIEVAPSRPNRVYLTMQPYETLRGQIYRSDDGGKTFTGGPNDLKASGPLFIASVDPKDPERVVVRHLYATGSDVLLSTDAGKTWREVLHVASSMYAFAKSEDGKTLWAGAGQPELGLFRSSDRGEHWENMSKNGSLCLHATGGKEPKLFVCENVFLGGTKTIGVSLDQGKTIQDVADFKDLKGPLACASPSDAGAALCAPYWASVRDLVFPKPDAGTSVPQPDAAAGGRGERAPQPKSSCSCGVVGAAREDGSLDLAWLTAGLLALAYGARARARIGSIMDQPGRAKTTRAPR
jgi:photosystem II stability/assembly factor-like uncharacterized protein